MGHRLEIYCREQIAESLIEIANQFNIEAKIIGRVEKSDTPGLSITTPENQIITF